MTGGAIVVVGGGCSGVLLTRELLRRPAGTVVLVDSAAEPGRGVAYGAAAPWHLLNSPAAAMSADPDEPGDFIAWCRAAGNAVEPGDFVPRRWYGEYLQHVLRSLDTVAPGRLEVHRGRVSRVFDGAGPELTVLLDRGVTVRAERVVLAVGNAAPAHPRGVDRALRAHPAYVADPWAPGALDGVPDDRPVLLVGTGLTAVDVALTLDARGRRAPMVAVSRHGLLPQPHRRPEPGDAAPVPAATWLPAPPVSLAALVRALRRAVAQAPDWRAVVDGMRPHLDRIWCALDTVQQQRFLRHLARYWEVHRHRMAPRVAAELTRLRETGALTVRAARVHAIRPDAGGLRVDVGSGDAQRFGAVVNCTGPGAWPDAADPLVRSLVADGLARSGPYAMGLDVDPDGAVLDRLGRPATALWALGPARRGHLWETTAVPEIRAQARRLAERFERAGADRHDRNRKGAGRAAAGTR